VEGLAGGKRLRFLEPGVLGDDIEVQGYVVRYKIGMDSTDYMLELSERPEEVSAKTRESDRGLA
jgi:hypothetical protein